MTTRIFPNDPAQLDTLYRTRLAGSEYLLKLRYNQRLDRHFAELYDTDGSLIRGSAKVVAGTPLWAEARYEERLPDAVLFPLTLNPDTSPPGLEDLGEGRRVELIVFEDG